MNQFRIEWVIAKRYIFSAKDKFISLASLLSFVGIALGVGILIVTLSLMSGLYESWRDKFVNFTGQIELKVPLKDMNSVTDLLMQYKNNSYLKQQAIALETVLQTYDTSALVERGAQSSGAPLRGIEADSFERSAYLKASIVSGEAYLATNKVIMGYSLARRLGVKIGDSISITTNKGVATPLGWQPKTRAFKVSGIFQTQSFVLDLSVMINKEDFLSLQPTLQEGNIEIYLNNPDAIDSFKGLLFQNPSLINQVSSISDWRENNRALFQGLETEKNVMTIILSCIILIAGFNIISSLVMMVKERYREIAVLRTIGFTRASIMRIFIMCGLWIGGLGTLIGFVGGYLFIYYIKTITLFLSQPFFYGLFSVFVRTFEYMPAKMVYGSYAYVVFFSLLLTLLACLYPSFRASRIQPVRIIREYE